jgi:hypothetical protein
MRRISLVLLTIFLLLPVASYARGSRGGFAPSSRRSAPITRSSSSAPRTSSTFTAPRTISSSYHPTFTGYQPPLGSRVYSPGFSLTELLFWSYLFNHNGYQQVNVQQPDGHTVTAQTGNIDVMYYIDLGLLLVFGFGIIGIIVWFVNKLTQPKDINRGTSYGTY